MSYVTEHIDRLLHSFANDPHLLTPGGHLLDFSEDEDVVSLVVGDLHGDFATLDETFRFFEELKRQEEGHRYRWIFLGDYVDRGPNSGALLDYLLRFRMEKMANNRTDDVYLLRGNHEDWLTGPQGVYTPVAGDPGQMLFLDSLPASEREQYRALFAALPVVAFLPGKVMVVHGGIPKPVGFPPDVDFPGVSDRASLENPELLSQMLWGDPVAVDWRIVAGTRFEFGRKQCEHFMERLDLAVIVRGHEPVAGGFRADYDGRVLTVFSSGAPSAETSYPMVETPALLVMGADRYSVFRRQQGGEALFVEEQCPLPRPLKAERDEAAARIREEELRAAQEAADQLERAAKEEELRKAIREAALRGAATARREEKARQTARPVVYKMADLMFIIDLEKSPATDALPEVMARFLYRLAGGDPEAFILKLLNLTTGFLNPALGNHVQLFVSSEQDREKRGGAFSDEQGVGAMLTGLLSGSRKGTAEKTMAAMLEVLRTKLWREQATRYLIVLTDSSSEEKTEVMTSVTAEAAARKVTVWVIGCDLSRKTVSLYEEVTRLPRCACIPLSKEQADWQTVFAKLHKSISATV